MQLSVVGLGHRQTPVALRERLAVSSEQLPDVLADLKAAAPASELVLVSTCNRVELTLFGLGEPVDPRALLERLAVGRGVDLAPLADGIYTHEGPAAVRHLFRVAGGLDSMLLGETEILGQVRQAFAIARDSGVTGKAVNAMFQAALTCGKAVRSQTQISAGRISVGSVAVEVAQRIFARLEDKTALILGAGETAELVVQHLVQHGLSDVLVANRSAERATALVERHGGHWLPLATAGRHLHRADILIGSTAAPQTLIAADQLEAALARRRGRPMYVLDLAVPRDIDPRAAELDGVFAYDIDDIQTVVAENLGRRAAEVERAQALVDEHCARFARVLEGLDVDPLIAALHQRGEAIRTEELERLALRAELPHELATKLELATRRIVSRLLHEPIKGIKTEAGNGNRYVAIDLFRKLFRLDDKHDAPRD